MDNTYTLKLTGTITPDESSPLATAPIRPAYEIAKSEKYIEGDDKTARLPRMARYFEATQSLAYTPYFPASAIRGALRRAARNVLFDYIKDKKWGLELHRLLTIGGVSSSGPEGDININAIQAFRKNNPLISLFGATSGPNNPWIEGRLSVGHAIPSEPFQPSIITGIRTDPVRRKPGEITMLNEASAAALDDICNAGRTVSKLNRQTEQLKIDLKNAKKAKSKDEAHIAQLTEQIEKVAEQIEEAAAISGSSVSIQLPLSGYETIPPSMPLNQRIVARGVTLVELGLFVASLRKFAKDPLLGAHQAHGCGIVRCDWDVSVGDINGKITLEPFIDIIVEGDDLSLLLINAEDHFKNEIAGCSEKSLLPA